MKNQMQMRFVGKISSMGDKYVIVVPKDKHDEAKQMKGKDVKVQVNDEIWEDKK